MSPERTAAISAATSVASAPASPSLSHVGIGSGGGLGSATDSGQFVQVNLDALDLEALYPDAAKNKRQSSHRNSDRPHKGSRDRFATLRSLGASMKGLVVSSSSSENLAVGPQDDDPAVVNWPSVTRTRRQWEEPVRSSTAVT